MPETRKNISRMNFLETRGAVVFGEVVYVLGGICGPRKQSKYQLVVIHRGSLTLQLDGESIAVAPGQAILLTPNHREYFQFSREHETHHSWCTINPSSVPPKMRRLFGSLRKPAPFDSHLASLLKLGMKTLSGYPANESLEDGFSLGIGLALLFGFAIAAQTGRMTQSPSDEALIRIEDFVSREYNKPLRLPDMAAAAGVSPQHLLKLFRERQWPTPTDYLYEKRLETAVDLLSHTGLSVGEIADRCGFTNPFHFSRKFRKAYGQSPRAWRTRAWSNGV